MEQIQINNLLWDTENLEIQGKKYFTWQEALDAAKIVGKRLPTKDELEKLIETGLEWDEEKKGMWMVDRELFFPAWGYKNNLMGTLHCQGSNVYVWSSSPIGGSSAYYFSGDSGDAYVSNNSRFNGFAVRCVQNIQSDNSTIKGNEEILQSSKKIDWEQRRYELARDLYCNSGGFDADASIKKAYSFIDRFIREEIYYEAKRN